MINIPIEIQDLFLQDSIKKNFRITFINGEYQDIINDQIIQESVIFTESVCSQDNLKLGLLELSVLEFEAKNIEIITDLEISAQIEIDISSLSTNIKNAYGQQKDDVPYVFYPIKYGIFRVYETKQKDENIYKVTAFTKEIEGLEYENYISTILTSNETVKINYQQLIDVYINKLNGQSGIATSWGQNSGQMMPIYSDVATINGNNYTLQLWGAIAQLRKDDNNNYAVKPMFTFNVSRFNEYQNELQNAKNYGFDAAQIQRAYMAAYPYFGSAAAESNSQINNGQLYILRLSAHPEFLEIKRIEITDNNNNIVYTYTMSGNIVSGDTSYFYNPPSSGYEGEIPTSSYDDAYELKWLDGNYDAKKIIEGYLEAQGLNARYGRNGNIEFFNYINGNIANYLPRHSEKIIIGRTAGKKYRKIIYALGDGENEKEGEIPIAYSGDIYDIRDNPAARYLNTSNADIMDFLEPLATQLKEINYTEFELIAKGKPYIQAGDNISITNTDGTIIKSIIMRRTITGIQHLVDTMEARGE